MPALVFPATGFTTSTQFTSTFATFSITVPGKVASRATMKSTDSRSFGKVLLRSSIRGLPVYTTPPKITTFKVPSNKISSIEINYSTVGKVLPQSNIRGLPVYTTPPKITTFKVPSNKISSIEINYSTVGKVLPQSNITGPIDLRQDFGKLSPFVNQGLTSGLRYAAMLSTIVNDNVGYTIYDRDILTSTRQSTTATQTLYFNPEQSYLSLTFKQGDFVNIVDSNTGFNTIAKVNTSTVNSITFNTISGLPNTSTGGVSIQSASADVYPTTATLASYYASLSTTGILITPTNPRENLAVSQMELPVLRYRAQQYYLVTKKLSDTLPLLTSTTNSLSTFNDNNIPGDFRLTVTGQTDQKIYNTILTYVNDLDILTYTTATVTVKTIYFLQQDATPFPSGSIVRIINVNTGYKQEFTVINGTSNSVSFTNPGNLPVSGTIEKSVASVYPQSFVNTQVKPTNARENLYYFNISPGLRAAQQYFISSGDAQLNNGNLGRQLANLKTPTTQLSVAKLSSAAKLKADSTTLKVDKLRSAAKLTTTGFTQPILFVSTITNFFNQFEVSTQVAPINARENLYYFNISPGIRNRSIAQIEIIGNSFLPTNLGLLKQPQANFVDIGTSLIKSGQIQKPISKLVYDTAIFNTGNLKSTAKLIADTSKFSKNNYISLFKIKSNTVQFFETPSSSKLVSVASLKSDRNIFRIDKLSATAVIRADKSRLTTDKLKSSAVLKEYGDSKKLYKPDNFSNYIDQITVRPTTAPTNASERFYYFNLAPGYRRNSSIQDGKLFSPIINIIKNDRLELFDNIGYQLDLSRIYNVSGQTTGVAANTLLSYLDDLDILTTTTAPISSVTIFFENIERTALPPFLVGDTVYVTKNQDVASMPVRGFVFTVIANSFNSITIAKPADWDTTWAFSTIRLTGAEYYPRAKVRTTVAPTNAREALYYAELGPGIRTNRTISYGNSLSDTGRIKDPNATIFKYVAGSNIPGASGFVDASIKPLVISTLTKDIFKLRGLLRVNTISLLTKDLLKLRTPAVNDSKGLIFKLIVGDGKIGANGFTDTGATKKEPIQFWN